MNVTSIDLIYLVPVLALSGLGVYGWRSGSPGVGFRAWLVLAGCVLATAIIRVLWLQYALSDWARQKTVAYHLYASRRDLMGAAILGAAAIACMGLEARRRAWIYVDRLPNVRISLILWFGFSAAACDTTYHYSDTLFRIHGEGQPMMQDFSQQRRSELEATTVGAGKEDLSTNRRRFSARGVIESLESRVLLNAGGGFTGSGITGSYYNNPTLSGTPSFTRIDDRIDFNWGTTGTPGGSPDPQYAALGTSNWSSKWVGQFIPKYSETYTFTVNSEGAVRLYVGPSGQSFASPQIDDFTEHTTAAVDTFSIQLVAGHTYDLELDYATTSSPSELGLQWSSPSTPTEDIEPAAEVGLNVDGGDGLFANLVNGGTRNYWWAPGNTNATIATDSNFWPTADAEIFLGEGDTTLNSGGTYLIQFKGTATVTESLLSASFHVGSTNYGGTLPDGAGYNSTTGLTTATMVISSGNYDGFILEFTNSSRDGDVALPTHDGITDLYVMQPTTLGGSTDPAPSTLFTNSALHQLSQYSALRTMGLTATNGNIVSDWSDRTTPSDEIWSGWSIAGGSNGVSARTTGSFGAGVPWEVCIALANQTGKDIYINLPSNASVTYIDDLANLFAYGSNGVTPYTSPQANPVWAPLNSNLKVYIEFSNEIWNFAFSQAGTGGNGWVNQISQRAVYDFETNNQNDPLYPGGGANGYNDGAIIAPLYITSSNKAAWLATYNGTNATYYGYSSPQYFSNSDSALQGYSIYQGWVALRLEQISTAFKSVFGETGINADSNSSRIRPVFEWQYGGNWDGELSDMQTLFGSSSRVGYYLYGGGGGWYADDTDAGFSDSTFANGNFATTAAVSGYQQNPSGTGWTYSGASGIAANGSSLANPTAPTVGPANNPVGSGQTAYLQPGASISQSVDFSGGWADITLLACQTIAANYSNDFYGMTISVDGTPIAESEGGLLYSGSQGSWTWDRTAAFDVSAGYHTITFTSTWASGGATVFFDNVGIQTVNGLFSQTTAGGAPLPGTNNNGVSSVASDVQICQQYGLFDVGYEGGFDFDQNLDGGDVNGYSEMGNKGYSSSTPNVGEEANLDPRTQALAESTIDQFYSAGGTLPIVFESTGNPNSWAVADPTYFDTNTPKQQAVAAVEQALPAQPAFGSSSVPGTLYPASKNQDASDNNGSLQSGGWIDWNIVVTATGTYTFDATTTTGGSYRLSINDINTLSTGISGGTIDPIMTLYPGVYTFKVEDTSGAFNVSQVVVSEVADTAVKLVIVQQPNSGTAGQTITPLIVDVEDQDGNVVTTDNSTVTLATSDGTTLMGTTMVQAVDGVATFSGFSMTQPGMRTLVAADGALTPATSAPITIIPAVALTTTMLINGVPSTGSIANMQRSQVTSLVITFSAPVTLSPGAILLTDQDSINPFGSVGASVPYIATASDGGQTYTLTFKGGDFVQRRHLATSLPNGHYVLDLDFASVASATAAVPAGNQSLFFHRLYGDLTDAGYITTVLARTDMNALDWSAYETLLDEDGASFSNKFDSHDLAALTASEAFVTGSQEQTTWKLYND